MPFTQEHADLANAMVPGTLLESLGIRFHVDTDRRFCATLPVDHRTIQPLGLLHGGATAALAESVGSTGSAMLIDLTTHTTVGLEITANHVKGARTGLVTATGELVHRGRTIHVWDIRVRNSANELIAVCRMTNMIMEQG